MRAAIFAIATAIAAVFFTSDIVGLRPLKGEERPSTVVGLFEQSPVPYDKAFVERHGLGDGEADEVLCERRTSFVLGGRRWESSPAGHVVVCQFRVTNDPGSRDPSSHPYAYFFRGSRWRLAEGEGLGAASGPTRKLVNWPLYWLGNGLILAALLVTLRFVRAHLLKGRRHSDTARSLAWKPSDCSAVGGTPFSRPDPGVLPRGIGGVGCDRGGCPCFCPCPRCDSRKPHLAVPVRCALRMDTLLVGKHHLGHCSAWTDERCHRWGSTDVGGHSLRTTPSIRRVPDEAWRPAAGSPAGGAYRRAPPPLRAL